VMLDDLYTDYLGFQVLLSDTGTGNVVPVAETQLNFDQLLHSNGEIRTYALDLFPKENNAVQKDEPIDLRPDITKGVPESTRSKLGHHAEEEDDLKISIESLEVVSSAAIDHQIRAPPELLVGLMYSRNNGKLIVSILKGQNFSPITEQLPESFVKVSLLSPYGDEIGKHKTAIRESSAAPIFDETFVFQVGEEELPYATLMMSVYLLIGTWRRQVQLGWVGFGAHNNSSTSPVAAAHWAQMRNADEQNIARWHTLTE